MITSKTTPPRMPYKEAMRYLLDILAVLFCTVVAACSTDHDLTHITAPFPTEEANNGAGGRTKDIDAADREDSINSTQVNTPIPTEGTLHNVVSQTMNFDGLERMYIIHVPDSYTGDEPVPLLFSYHGYGASAAALLEYTDFISIADEEGFILVYPQGSLLGGKTHWNVGGWTNRSTTDDVGFTEAMIDVLSKEYNIDLSRVYATGHSNGGYLSFRLACDLSDKIAAIASVAGSMTPETHSSCDPERPVPIIQIHGTADETVSYDGAYWSLSIAEMLDYWVTRNGCDPSPIIEKIAHSPNTTNDTSVEHILYVECDNDLTVEHYKYTGGGHEWPGTVDEMGQINADLDTNLEMWTFLSRHKIDVLSE